MAKSFGLPRLIIAGFLLLLYILAPIVGADLPTQITNTINRFSWNAIMVLAMVPMVHSGCGLNFGLPLGIISGLLGATLSIELGFTGGFSFIMAMLLATPFALILGWGYGWLLNRIKGGEMMIATYVGFSSVSLMCMMWLLLPYHSPNTRAKGVEIRTAIKNERGPVKPSSIDIVAPRSPDIIPKGSPKFKPQPECTIGTIASTSMPFQLKRLMIFEICVGRSAPTIGAMINKRIRKPVIISLGSPKSWTKPFILPLEFILFSSIIKLPYIKQPGLS